MNDQMREFIYIIARKDFRFHRKVGANARDSEEDQDML